MKRLKLTTDVKVIKNKDIDTLEFRLIFPIKYDNDNHYYIELLNLFISTCNYKIRDYGEFKKGLLKKTILNLSLSSRNVIDNTYLLYSFSLPKENLIKGFDLEESFKFAIDTLLNPACEEGAFDAAKFNYEMDYIYQNYKRSRDGIYASNSHTFYEKIDPEDELGNSYEKNGKLLESMDNKKMYAFYKKNILDNNFIPYVYGDISVSRARKLFNTYIPQDKEYLSFNINYFKALPLANPSYEEIRTNYNQSELFLEYQVEMTEKERKYFSAIINILTGPENNLIFDSLRVKNNLVYDVKVNSFSSRAMFVINAFIPSNKYREAKKLIKEVIESLKDKEKVTIYLEKLIKGLEVELLKEQDSDGKPLNDAINKDLQFVSTEELISKTKSIKVADLVKFVDRLKLTNEMFFRGESDD